MKIGIVTHGIPNLFSEGTTKEAIILIEELKKRNISTKLFIQNYTKYLHHHLQRINYSKV